MLLFSAVLNMSSSDVFSGAVDRYRGVTVKTSTERCRSVDEFSTKLVESLKKWTSEVGKLITK
jgi:hypothetical protein